MTTSDSPREEPSSPGGPAPSPGLRSGPGVSRRRLLKYAAAGGIAAAAPTAGGAAASAASEDGRRAPAGSPPAQETAALRPEGTTGTIADVKHVVILMQENRSF